MKSKIFLQKKHSCVTLKRQKNKFPHSILGIVMVSTSLSDESMKILEI